MRFPGPVVLCLVIRDEVDLIRTHLEYHFRRGVDLVLATDHRSVDGTSAVLHAYERAGRLRLFREDGEAFDQATWSTRMARLAAVDHGASWVLHADADELWWPAVGNIQTALAAVPVRVGSMRAPRTNFLPSRATFQPFWSRMRLRDLRSENSLGQPLPPKVCHRGATDVVLHSGDHAVTSATLGPEVDATTLEIFHYPVRTWPQLERKIAQGMRAVDAHPAWPDGAAATWRHLEAERRAGRLRPWWEAQVALGDRADGVRYVRDDRVARFLGAD